MTNGGETFSVDTHLFRELGELLVGRKSTALIELIKNAYDADATEIIVRGENLGSPEEGFIAVSDDGVGMTKQEFVEGFLTVASRSKREGARSSPRYGRQYTGQKGVGRLAAHKLSAKLHTSSEPDRTLDEKPDDSGGVWASINWKRIESEDTLQDVKGAEPPPIKVEELEEARQNVGTTICLDDLRESWSYYDKKSFIEEVSQVEIPAVLLGQFDDHLPCSESLLGEPTTRISDSGDPGFQINLKGEFSAGDSYWKVNKTDAQWLLEVEVADDRVEYFVSPLGVEEDKGPEAQYSFSESELGIDEALEFEARLLVRKKPGEVPGFSEASGVRVYMEGFRVPPYGDDGNDWLDLKERYHQRSRSVPKLSGLDEPDEIETGEDAGLKRLKEENFIGGVFLHQDTADSLKMVVNREGFVPNDAFEEIRRIVKNGINLVLRVRAHETRLDEDKTSDVKSEASDTEEEKEPQGGETEREQTGFSVEKKLDEVAKDTNKKVERAEEHLETGHLSEAKEILSSTAERFRREVKSITSKTISQQRMVRVLASVGLQLGGFVHEVRNLLSMAETVDRLLQEVRSSGKFSGREQSTIKEISEIAYRVREGLERHTTYLTKLVSPRARKRRSRQRIRDRAEDALEIIKSDIEEKSITTDIKVPEGSKTPPMFPAELITILTNLLSNAVKAAGKGGRIAISSKVDDERVVIRIENTGEEVDLETSEELFEPFYSTTVDVNAAVGEGMGLGLSITRTMVREYGGSIEFVVPSEAFSTAIEVELEDS